MPTCPILHIGNPLLWERSVEVEEVTSGDTKQIIQDLEDTLTEFRKREGFGRAIAAPQIGRLSRVIFIRRDLAGLSGALINPSITWKSEETIEIWDDCLSIPNLMVKVKRAARIRINYTDETGNTHTQELDGDLSELIQHEYDHLDGFLATQRAIDSKSFCTRAEWRKIHKS